MKAGLLERSGLRNNGPESKSPGITKGLSSRVGVKWFLVYGLETSVETDLF